MGKSVADGKASVASAITAQGVSTAADASFKTITSNITAACNNKYESGKKDGGCSRSMGPYSVSNVDSVTNQYNVGSDKTLGKNCFVVITEMYTHDQGVSFSWWLSGSTLYVHFERDGDHSWSTKYMIYY